MEKHNQKVQTYSYKISTKDVMYSMRKWMLTKLTVVIVSQYMLSENMLLYTLNLHKSYMSIYISNLKKIKGIKIFHKKNLNHFTTSYLSKDST